MSWSDAFKSTGLTKALIGMHIDGRYQVLECIGQGGFATVYKANHVHLDRLVALKVLKEEMLDPHHVEEYKARFLREARSTASIRHSNVVTIHDYGFFGPDQLPYLVMDLLEGRDLDVELKTQGAMAQERAVRLFIPCLEALAHAHTQGIIHRDLKPSNLFLEDPGQDWECLRIFDFGVAGVDRNSRDTNHHVRELTSAGQTLGTPQYIAPEYAREGTVSPALDVYQMGLILVEMIMGFPAVEEVHHVQCVQRHISGDLNIPDSLKEGPLGEVVLSALALEPSGRYKNASEFLDALGPVAHQLYPHWTQRNPPRPPRLKSSQRVARRRPKTAQGPPVAPITQNPIPPPEQALLLDDTDTHDDEMALSITDEHDDPPLGEKALEPLDRVPHLTQSLSKLSSTHNMLDHKLGYLLSLIDGRVTLQELLELAPMLRNEAVEALLKASSLGLIRIE